MRFRFHPDALAEFQQAAVYYEEQETGLGERFIEIVDSAVANVVRNPKMWPVIEDPVRRKLTKIFPYAIIFAENENYILILAVMHCHQDPDYWKSRI